MIVVFVGALLNLQSFGEILPDTEILHDDFTISGDVHLRAIAPIYEWAEQTSGDQLSVVTNGVMELRHTSSANGVRGDTISTDSMRKNFVLNFDYIYGGTSPEGSSFFVINYRMSGGVVNKVSSGDNGYALFVNRSADNELMLIIKTKNGDITNTTVTVSGWNSTNTISLRVCDNVHEVFVNGTIALATTNSEFLASGYFNFQDGGTTSDRSIDNVAYYEAFIPLPMESQKIIYSTEILHDNFTTNSDVHLRYIAPDYEWAEETSGDELAVVTNGVMALLHTSSANGLRGDTTSEDGMRKNFILDFDYIYGESSADTPYALVVNYRMADGVVKKVSSGENGYALFIDHIRENALRIKLQVDSTWLATNILEVAGWGSTNNISIRTLESIHEVYVNGEMGLQVSNSAHVVAGYFNFQDGGSSSLRSIDNVYYYESTHPPRGTVCTIR